MSRFRNDALFGMTMFLLVCAVVIIAPFEKISTGGLAYYPQEQKSVVPFIDLLAPDNEGNTYSPIQEFLFRVHSVDYPVTCSVIVDNEVYSGQEVSPEALAKFSTSLGRGYHEWSVQCELLNGRTISSIPRVLWVKDYRSLEDDFAITGRVVDVSVKDPRSYMLVLILAGLAVWTVNLSRRKK